VQRRALDCYQPLSRGAEFVAAQPRNIQAEGST
jgi:hypothetical protein